MVAILDGALDYPILENELAAAQGQYKVLVVSTSHLHPDEFEALGELSADPGCKMIMENRYRVSC